MKQIITAILSATIYLSVSAQTDSLPQYLKIAAENNPGVKAAFLTWQAALQKVPQAGALQDPQLDLGFFLQPMEITDGKQVADIKLMQMFPWFGTRKAARTEVLHMAQMAFEQFRETRDKLFLDVYTRWFTLCRLQQQLNNNRENRKLLTHLEELALQKFIAPLSSPTPSPMSQMSPMSQENTPALASILQIRLEIAETDNNMENIQSEIQAEKAKLNTLMNRSAESGIQIPDSLKQIPFLLDIPAATTRMANQNPMLNMISEEELAYRAKAEMDRKMSYPMFGIGLQYMLIDKKPVSRALDSGMDGMSSTGGMNGRDMIMPMVSVSIPVYRSKYRAQQRENAFLQQASREKYADTRNMLEAELYRIKRQLDDAARRIALYRKQKELAQTAFNLMIQEFASGKNDLSNVIQVQRQLLDYELKTAEAVAGYNTMVANIQKLMSDYDK